MESSKKIQEEMIKNTFWDFKTCINVVTDNMYFDLSKKPCQIVLNSLPLMEDKSVFNIFIILDLSKSESIENKSEKSILEWFKGKYCDLGFSAKIYSCKNYPFKLHALFLYSLTVHFW